MNSHPTTYNFEYLRLVNDCTHHNIKKKKIFGSATACKDCEFLQSFILRRAKTATTNSQASRKRQLTKNAIIGDAFNNDHSFWHRFGCRFSGSFGLARLSLLKSLSSHKDVRQPSLCVHLEAGCFDPLSEHKQPSNAATNKSMTRYSISFPLALRTFPE